MKALVFALLLCGLMLPRISPKPCSPPLLSAKTVMLHGDQKSMDEDFDEPKKWGRFEIVTYKSKADLIFEFIYVAEPDNRQMAQKETLVIYDAKSGESVYQDSRDSTTSSIWISMARAMVKTVRKRLKQQ